MHIGNARAALFNYLQARGHQGTFLLRIEDTDKQRSEQALAEFLMKDLEWLEIQWQEGPGVLGPHEPYYQSQRHEIYNAYYEKLVERDLVYPCFCSDDELMLQRKIQISRNQPPRYSGKCAHLTRQDIRAKIDAGETATLRFRVPLEGEVAFEDLVKGRQVFLNKNIGDFIIRRADGSASFIFCNAIDDALMGVTMALRGDDHLANTPRQLMIIRALGLTAPQYGHISLILGQDGAPLSKRNGSMSVGELREQGFLPMAILNYLSRLGHYYDQAFWLNLTELADFFDVTHLGTAPSRFDMTQLMYWQKEAVQRLLEEDFWSWVGEETKALIPEKMQSTFFEAIKGNVVFPSDAQQWVNIIFSSLTFNDEALAEFSKAGKAYFDAALKAWPQANFKSFMKELGAQLQLKGKALFEPMRLALTGRTDGPELAQLDLLLTKDQVRERLQHAKEHA